MTTYKFSMASDGTLICYKTNNGLFKYTGKSALKLLEHIKDFSFYAFSSVTNKVNTDKYTYDLRFTSNNHLVTFVNIHKFKNKECLCIEDEIKSLLDIIKNNSIVLKQEIVQEDTKPNFLYKVKTIFSVAAVAFMLVMENKNVKTQQNFVTKHVYQETQIPTKGINFTNANIESKYIDTIKNMYNTTNTTNNNIYSISNNENTILSNNVISDNTTSDNIILNNNISINDIETISDSNIDMISENIVISNNDVSDNSINNAEYTGKVLNAYNGTIAQGPSGGKETYYDLNMTKVIEKMRDQGFDEDNYPYWIREDGVKMLGDYVMVAASLDVHPRGSFVATSLGQGLVCDTGEFAKTNKLQLDIATNWSH